MLPGQWKHRANVGLCYCTLQISSCDCDFNCYIFSRHVNLFKYFFLFTNFTCVVELWVHIISAIPHSYTRWRHCFIICTTDTNKKKGKTFRNTETIQNQFFGFKKKSSSHLQMLVWRRKKLIRSYENEISENSGYFEYTCVELWQDGLWQLSFPYPDGPDQNGDQADCGSHSDAPCNRHHDVTVKPDTGRAAGHSADGEMERRGKRERWLLKWKMWK